MTIVAKAEQPIGVFDSGVGGLTVINKLRHLLPHEDIIYVGDTKRNPYGTRTQDEILTFTEQIIAFLERRQVKLIVFACNTATAVAYMKLKEKTKTLLLGMSRGIETARHISTENRIAVFATPLTIANHIHRDEAARLDPSLTIVEQPCASLASLIERGRLNTEEMRQAVTADTKPVLEAHVDTAIFGCTHYPFVQPLFEEICGDSIVFVDPAHETALQASAILKKEGLLNGQKERGRLRLCFTAEAQRGQKLAAHLLPPHEFTTEEVVLS